MDTFETGAPLARLSYKGRRIKQKCIRALLHRASLQGDVFDEAADYLGRNNDDFDRVILSIRLLISLLSATLDDTMQLSTHRNPYSGLHGSPD